MDITKEVNKVTATVIADKLPKMIEERVISMMESIIGDMFSNYSDAKKQIEKKISESLDINLQEFKMLDYNSIVAGIINDSLIKQVNLTTGPIKDMISNTIGYLNKKEFTLEEIVESITSDISSESLDWGDEHEGNISLHIEEHDSYDWWIVSMDMEADKKPDECAIHFTLFQDSGRMCAFQIKSTWREKGLSPLRLQSLENIEQRIFRIYSSGSVIKHDGGYIETRWNKQYN